MATEITNDIQYQAWYEDLVDELNDIITETSFTSRWALVEGYHQVGTRILQENDNFERAKMYYSLRKAKGNCHWEDFVDYSISELKQHLELLFKPGMSWDNYGDWEIDHVIPVSAFKYSSPNDLTFKQCWSLTNLQPLWRHDNRTKGGMVQPQRLRLGTPQASA